MPCQHDVVNCRLHVDEGFDIDKQKQQQRRRRRRGGDETTNNDDDEQRRRRDNDDEQRRTTRTTNDDDDDDDDERRRRRRRRRQRTSMFSRMKIRGAMVCSLIPFISVLIISVPSVKFANPSLNPHTSTSLFYPINTRTSTDQFCRTFRSTVF